MNMDKVLQAYAYSVLAKDASGKYSNPRRALRSYEDIMEMASLGDVKNSMKDRITAAIADVQKEEVVEVEKPKYDAQSVTKKEFYNFRTEMIAEIKKLTPPPVTP